MGIGEIPFADKFSPIENSDGDFDPDIKHYIRWKLFRSCLKTDVSFIEAKRIPEEIADILSKEFIRRHIVDAALNKDVGRGDSLIYFNKRADTFECINLKEVAELIEKPWEYQEKIKELKKRMREFEGLPFHVTVK